jgi:EmrB/QacA subfamily drug resistance transporter
MCPDAGASHPIMFETLSRTRKLTIYVAVLFGVFMSALDMQIVATALPTIAADLGNLELFGWVGAAYLLATASVTPFYGKLGDLFGRKRIYMFSIALFTLGSAACGLAWSMESLIAARVLQGLGGGGLMTSAFAIIADLFEPRERAKYQGYSSAVFTLAGISGPVAGGLIAETLGWQFIFLVNVPIGIVLIAALGGFMPHVRTGRTPSIDIPGGLLLAAGVTATVFWAEEALGGGYGGVMLYLLPAIAVVAFVLFVRVERRAVEPILPLAVLGERTVALSLAISVISGVATLGMLNYFALFLQTVLALSPAQAGLMFLPSSIGSLLASIGTGLLMARTGRYKMFPVAAMALGMVVMLAFSQVRPDTPLALVAVLMFFFSASIGLQMQTLMVAVQSSAPHRDVGAATGALALARMIGASLGLAANGGLLGAMLMRAEGLLDADTLAALTVRLRDVTPAMLAELPQAAAGQVLGAFDGAFGAVFLFGASLFAAGLLLAVLLPNRKLESEAGRHAPALAE